MNGVEKGRNGLENNVMVSFLKKKKQWYQKSSNGFGRWRFERCLRCSCWDNTDVFALQVGQWGVAVGDNKMLCLGLCVMW